MHSANVIATAALLLAGSEALVFKAVNHCTQSVLPPPQARSLDKRQQFCDMPFLVAYSDDGTQLTFNGGNKHYDLPQETGVQQGPCYATNGDYNGSTIDVDPLDGKYTGGKLNFLTCGGGSAQVAPDGCMAKIDGRENDKSTKTNCNDCKGDGFESSCNCCAVTF